MSRERKRKRREEERGNALFFFGWEKVKEGHFLGGQLKRKKTTLANRKSADSFMLDFCIALFCCFFIRKSRAWNYRYCFKRGDV